MRSIPQDVSESFRKRNPHLYTQKVITGELPTGETISIVMPRKRIRQSTKPLMNKLEQRFWGYLSVLYTSQIVSQGLKFRLANGCWYCPDFVVWGDENNDTRAFEVKGGKPIQDDSVVKIKIAAKEYHWIRWYLIWWDKNQWHNQLVIP